MRIEMMVDEKFLPNQGITKISDELHRRLQPLYPDVRIRVRKGTNNQLEIYAKDKNEKKVIHNLIEQAFSDADEWLLNAS